VQLPHLLWVRCAGNAEKALKATDLIIQAGGFGVVALDLAGVAPRDARRISLASCFACVMLSRKRRQRSSS